MWTKDAMLLVAVWFWGGKSHNYLWKEAIICIFWNYSALNCVSPPIQACFKPLGGYRKVDTFFSSYLSLLLKEYFLIKIFCIATARAVVWRDILVLYYLLNFVLSDLLLLFALYSLTNMVCNVTVITWLPRI